MPGRDPSPSQASRRAFLRGAVGMASTGGAARAAEAQGEIPDSMTRQGAPVLNSPYGAPSSFEAKVVRHRRSHSPLPTVGSSTTPLQELHGIITPNGLHFERHYAGVPAIDPAQHRLMVHGMVERPLVFAMEDLLRFPSVSRIHFIECSGNSSWTTPAPGATAGDIHGLVSCCEWTGPLLSTVLEEAGVGKGAAWVLAEGADAAALTRSIPIEKALDDAILAYAQNGERLRPEQGYPLRLVLPGFEGNMSVKWLRRLKLGDQPFQTREETSKYTDLMPDGTARQFTFVMEAKSVITLPSGGQTLPERGFYEISGLAWSGRGRIVRVEVSTDGGASWSEAVLQTPVLSKCLTRFRAPWRWDGQAAELRSRATDETGYVQPEREALVAARGLNSGYHYNGVQAWRVAANGTVSHAP